jgi:hypothetical protein
MKLFWVGLIITVLYFLILGLTVLGLNLSLMQSWNEFGDFLAGAFSPVAFLWLVLGFIQQQKELQQNTEALKLQADELKNSVDQYKEMVAIAREQLLADSNLIIENKMVREAETKPELKIRGFGWTVKSGILYTYKLQIYSDEREARNVSIKFTNAFGGYDEFRYGVIKSSFQLPDNQLEFSELPDEVEVFISFDSVIGKTYKHRYRYYDLEDGRYKMAEHQELAV